MNYGAVIQIDDRLIDQLIEQSACISNCAERSEVSLPQRLFEIYGLSM